MSYTPLSFGSGGNVTFGSTGSQITATAPAGGGGGVALSAGTVAITSGTAVFSNANGVTFGANGQTVTASHNGLTSQSAQAFSANGGSSAFQTLSFSDANGATFSNVAGAVQLSYTVPSTAGLLSAIRLSAGTSSANLSAVTMSDANGVSFGLNGSVITASHNGLTSQSAQAYSAANGSATFQTLSFANSNGVSFSTGTQGLFASYTVPSTAGLLSAINLSAGTTSQNLSAMTFSNANGVSFGLNGSVVTASHNGLTSQSNQAVSAANGSSTFQTLSLANSNGVSFSTGTQGLFASHNGITSQTIQTGNLSAIGNTLATNSVSATYNASGLQFAASGVASVGVSNGSVVFSVPAGGGGLTNIRVIAGTESNNLSVLSFANSNGVSFGLNSTVMTASAAFRVIAGTESNNLTVASFANSNNVSFGLSGSVMTASVNAGGGGATVSLWPALPHAWATSSMYTGASTTVGGGSSSTLSFYVAPLVLPVAVTFNGVGAIVSALNASGTGTGSHRHVLGIYTRTNSTLNLVTEFGWNAIHSFSSSTAQTLSFWAGGFAGSTAASTSRISGNVSASITGLRGIELNASSAATSLSAGEYFIAHAYNHRTTGANTGAMGSAWRHSVSQFTGAFGFSNTSTPLYCYCNGIVSTVTTATQIQGWGAPASISLGAITATGGTSQNQWPLVILRSVTA
jgi:hypothetical protein